MDSQDDTQLANSNITSDFVVQDNGQQIYSYTVNVEADPNSGTGFDIEVTVAPEPSSIGLLGIARWACSADGRSNRRRAATSR